MICDTFLQPSKPDVELGAVTDHLSLMKIMRKEVRMATSWSCDIEHIRAMDGQVATGSLCLTLEYRVFVQGNANTQSSWDVTGACSIDVIHVLQISITPSFTNIYCG